MLPLVHPFSILHQIRRPENSTRIWFSSWMLGEPAPCVFSKLIQQIPRCEDLFTPGDAVDFQRLQRWDSQKLEAAVRWFSKRQTCMAFFLDFFFGIEFWGARLGDGVASGAPGDQTSRRPQRGRRGWEAVGAVIPRAQGHQGAALNQCDKSRSWEPSREGFYSHSHVVVILIVVIVVRAQQGHKVWVIVRSVPNEVATRVNSSGLGSFPITNLIELFKKRK